MKKKVLSLACAVGLSTVLVTGCGITDTNRNIPGNNNGVTTRGTNQGFLLAERDRISNTAEDARMRHLSDTENTGSTGPNGKGGTGIGGDTGTMTSTANALLIGDVLIVAGDGSGVMGMLNRISGGEQGGTTGMSNRTMGSVSQVWQVTDKDAIKALNRVRVNLSSMNPRTKASEIGRDLSFLLKYVKPAGQGTDMSHAGNTNGSGER